MSLIPAPSPADRAASDDGMAELRAGVLRRFLAR